MIPSVYRFGKSTVKRLYFGVDLRDPTHLHLLLLLPIVMGFGRDDSLCHESLLRRLKRDLRSDVIPWSLIRIGMIVTACG